METGATKDGIQIQQNDSSGLRILVDYTITLNIVVDDIHADFTPSSNNQALVQ